MRLVKIDALASESDGTTYQIWIDPARVICVISLPSATRSGARTAINVEGVDSMVYTWSPAKDVADAFTQ